MKPIAFEVLEPRQLMCDTHQLELSRNPSAASFALVAADANQQAAANAATPISSAAGENVRLTWSSKKSMPQKREEGASAVLSGKLYVFGGFYDHTFTGTGRVDAYDPASNTWSQKKSIPEAITHAPSLVINGEAWLFGGYVGKDPGPPSKKVHIYNATSNTWRRGPDMPDVRGAGAVAQVGQTVYFFGGRGPGRTFDVPEMYALDLSTNTWSIKANLPNPRNHIAGIAVDGYVYAVGGQWQEASQAVNQDDVHRYDPTTNSWTEVASIPLAVSHNTASIFSYNGRIVMAGGEKAHNVSTARVYSYSPVKDRWDFLGDMPAARRAPAAGIINDRIYLAGGSLVGSQKYDLYMSAPLSTVISSSQIYKPFTGAALDHDDLQSSALL